ncbi:MAG: DEAD/DEAH box helicase [Pseudomonadota bacterium]
MTTDVDTTQEIPRADRPRFLTETLFESFDLPEPLLRGLTDEGFIRCSPIQAQTLPVSLQGKDVAGQAQTGTGKTAAFLVTLFCRLLATENLQPGLPMALIVAPTRELALQIYEEAARIGRYLPFTMAQVVGGLDYGKQADQLRHGVDIVICTPGRAIDYYKQKIFKTDNIRIVVIDEADRLLDLGFEKDMRYILRNLPHYEKRQSMLFSATLSHRVLELTYEYMNLPEFISVTPEDLAVEGIDQVLYHVGKDEKLPLLLGLLKREDWNRMLIFVNTKIGVEWLAQKLKGNGWPAQAITGDIPQKTRFRLMDDFKDGKIKILVATDVASRGIHVDDITHVVNYDLPQDQENYIHRIGRTARAGKSGRAISLACETYVHHLQPVEDYIAYKIPVAWPEEDWFVEDVAGRVAADRQRRSRKPEGRGGRPTGGRSAGGRTSGGRPAGGREGGGRPPGGRPSAARPADGRAQGPRSAPVKERPVPWPPRPEGYFPGTFFGFAASPSLSTEDTVSAPPEWLSEEVMPTKAAARVEAASPEAGVSAEDVAPEAATVDAPKPKGRPRRRKPRKRKKRAAPADSGQSPPDEAAPVIPGESSAEAPSDGVAPSD